MHERHVTPELTQGRFEQALLSWIKSVGADHETNLTKRAMREFDGPAAEEAYRRSGKTPSHLYLKIFVRWRKLTRKRLTRLLQRRLLTLDGDLYRAVDPGSPSG